MLSILGTVLVIFRGGLLGMWLCLEVGFFGFIPIINGKTVAENESTVKYFVIQGVGSGVMLFRFLIVGSDYYITGLAGYWRLMGDYLIIIGFIIKLGVFPIHF